MNIHNKTTEVLAALIIVGPAVLLVTALSLLIFSNKPEVEYKYIIIFTNIGIEGMPDSLFYHIECEPPCVYPEDAAAIRKTKDRFYESRGIKE